MYKSRVPKTTLNIIIIKKKKQSSNVTCVLLSSRCPKWTPTHTNLGTANRAGRARKRKRRKTPTDWHIMSGVRFTGTMAGWTNFLEHMIIHIIAATVVRYRIYVITEKTTKSEQLHWLYSYNLTSVCNQINFFNKHILTVRL